MTRTKAAELKRSGVKLSKKEAGSLGGQTTLKKYGRNFLAANAVRGARAFHEKYKWVPVGTSDFALSLRETGTLTGKTINGKVLPARGWQP